MSTNEPEHNDTSDNDQDARSGGYGGSTGGQNPAPQRRENDDEGAASAVGRDDPASGSADADEAMGNRSGGYGSAPEGRTEQPGEAEGGSV